MARTIWLIVEGDKDGDIVTAILKRKYPSVIVKALPPSGGRRNVSRLANQIERLVQQALDNRQKGDCIAVLHDADYQTRLDRDSYEKIKRICEKHKRDVKLVIAVDEIESWLLADAGFCKWLGVKAQNHDEIEKPSEKLQNLLDKKGKSKYRVENISKILSHVDGTGDNHSTSLKSALEHLIDAPCTRA